MAQIRLANYEGDKVVATYDPTDSESVKVAQEELTRFLEECVERFNTKPPPVWGRRLGAADFAPFEGRLEEVDTVLLQYPLAGG